MTGYLFSPEANLRLDEIWEYSETKYGTQKAEKYMIGLHDHIQKLSEKKKIWKTLPSKWVIPPDLKAHIYLSKYERHFLFFREFKSKKIGIMSILHENMNIPVHLKTDLNKIINSNPTK